jgi:hypothetical protein
MTAVTTSRSSFFFQSTICYDVVCSSVEAPWVTDLGAVPASQDLVVLFQDLGISTPAGVYTRGSIARGADTWIRVLSYYDMCNTLSNAGELKVILNATTSQTFATGTMLYKNGQLVSGTTLTPDPYATWAVVSVSSGGGGGAATTAASLLGGAANQVVYQTSPNTTSFIAAPTATGQVLTYTSGGFAWADPPAGYKQTVELNVTGYIPAGTSLNVNTASGPYTITGSGLDLGSTSAVFDAGKQYLVALNGVVQANASDAIWISSSQLAITSLPLYAGDKLTVSFTTA